MTKAIDIFLDRVAAGETIEPVEAPDNQVHEEFIRNQQNKLAKKTRSRKLPDKKSVSSRKSTAGSRSTKTAAASSAKRTPATRSAATKPKAVKKSDTGQA